LRKPSKNKDEFLDSNHFQEKPCLNLSLSYWLIILLQDLSWDRPSDWKFLKCLVFNYRYAGIVQTCGI